MTSSEIYAEISPSVVQVFSLSINPFLVTNRIATRVGTGFVLEEGYILTNYHVVADAKMTLVLQAGKSIDATVIGIDPTLDVALLRPWSNSPIGPPLEFADSAEPQIGQQTFAIGFPLGLGKSISSGIVSGVGRVLRSTTSSWLSPYLQTDAAISPGNSGGPLVDSCGQVIGMITSGISDYGAENIGFAIPVQILRPVIAALIDEGHVSRPWHGLYGQMTTPLILQVLGIPPEDWDSSSGFLIETVEPGSAAEVAGLRGGTWPMMWGGTEILLGGDIITHVNGSRMDSLDTALDAVRGLKAGERVELKVLRNGEAFTVSVLVRERPIIPEELELYRHYGQR
jgi:putative serine protease PepD